MVYRGQTGQNSSTLDTLNRLTFVSAKYAKERPTYRTFESNTVLLLDGNREGADKVGFYDCFREYFHESVDWQPSRPT